MKQQLIHRAGGLYWNIFVEDGHAAYLTQGGLPFEDTHITIKSNCKEYHYYPTKAFVSVTDKENASAFLIWVKRQPMHQLPIVVKCMLLGYRQGFGWADHYLQGRGFYEALCRGETIEEEEKAKLALQAVEVVQKETLRRIRAK